MYDQLQHTTKPKLIDQARKILRRKHYSLSTERHYLEWIRRFIKFHHRRHPRSMGKEEIESFLTHLALKHKVATSTQNQALNEILFLNRDMFLKPHDMSIHTVRASWSKRVPTVLSTEEAQNVRNPLGIGANG